MRNLRELLLTSGPRWAVCNAEGEGVPPASAGGGAPAGEPPPPPSVGSVLYPNGGDKPEGEPGARSEVVAPPVEPTPPPAAEPGPQAQDAPKPVEPKPEGETPPQPEPALLSLDSYKDLKLPEGFTVDETNMAAYREWGLVNKLTPEQAQAGLELYTKAVSDAMTASQAAAQTSFSTMVQAWETEVNAKPAWQGPERTRSEAIVQRMFEEFGDPTALKQALNATGMGSNPQFLDLMLNLANVLTEGEPVTPGGSAASGGKRRNRSLGERLYGPDTQ